MWLAVATDDHSSCLSAVGSGLSISRFFGGFVKRMSSRWRPRRIMVNRTGGHLRTTFHSTAVAAMPSCVRPPHTICDSVYRWTALPVCSCHQWVLITAYYCSTVVNVLLPALLPRVLTYHTSPIPHPMMLQYPPTAQHIQIHFCCRSTFVDRRR